MIMCSKGVGFFPQNCTWSEFDREHVPVHMVLPAGGLNSDALTVCRSGRNVHDHVDYG